MNMPVCLLHNPVKAFSSVYQKCWTRKSGLSWNIDFSQLCRPGAGSHHYFIFLHESDSCGPRALTRKCSAESVCCCFSFILSSRNEMESHHLNSISRNRIKCGFCRYLLRMIWWLYTIILNQATTSHFKKSCEITTDHFTCLRTFFYGFSDFILLLDVSFLFKKVSYLSFFPFFLKLGALHPWNQAVSPSWLELPSCCFDNHVNP